MRWSGLFVIGILGGCQAETAPADAPPPPPAAGGAKRAPCTFGQDQTCNADPAVSALWGRCTELGVCECKPGFELAPSGYCQPSP